ncbi:relaxin receptor 2 [Culicoides brevitarsis]|uniref:relaxin receptor 2 n=1 Tax=Culicoides brevitarsis TaxID=469753 RepID=UPI00307C1AC9
MLRLTSCVAIFGIFSSVFGPTTGISSTMDSLERPKKCSYERIAKMSGYTCSGMNYNAVPDNLKTGIEVFDLSNNRIRELSRKSFERYTDLKYLYLFENLIMEIENGTFSQLRGLEALDLSHNGLSTIPLELLFMDRLRNLYVAGNKLSRLDADIASLTRPITSPFQILNLADTFISRIPKFGILPDLWQLNVSDNTLSHLTFDQLQGFCGLRSIDFNNSYVPVCECRLIDVKLFERGADVLNLNCVGGFHQPNCAPVFDQNATDTQAALDYVRCLGIRQGREADVESRSRWLYIAASLLGFLIIFIAFLYCLHRKNVEDIKRKTKMISRANSVAQQNDFISPEKLITNEKV